MRKNKDFTNLHIHLNTWNEEEFIEQSITNLDEIKIALEEQGVLFTYDFREAAHDRFIDLDNGWLIMLGRGLDRSEEHTSELQSRGHLVCSHLLEKKKK